METLIILIIAPFFLIVSAAEAGPMPVGSDTMPLQGGSPHATSEWAKADLKLTTAQTSNLQHSCNKDLHSPRCVRKCVVKATEVQPTGLPPIWHVRGGTAFPVRDKQAEGIILDQIYSPKLTRKRQVQATVIQAR